MKIFPILIILAVSVILKAEINKLFFSGSSAYIECPGEGTFYQWKKYYQNQMTNLLSDDKRRLMIPLRADLSPTIYECSGTNGFINFNENITIFVLDQQSTQARKLCFISKSTVKPIAQFPCFLHDQSETVVRGTKGLPVSLNCEAGGINISYIWYRLNTPNSHQELLYKYANIPVLKIDKVDDGMMGQYLCIVNTTSGDNLKRFFDLQLFEPTNTNMIFINGPSVINVSVKLNQNKRLTCQAEAVKANIIHLIQWAKKIEYDTSNTDKSLVIKWGDSLYKLIPENQVQTSKISEPSVTTSLLLNSITKESAGEYICSFFTNIGKMKHKTFSLTVETFPIDNSERSFLFLYILIPSLIIAICIFVSLYLIINRINSRKASNSATATATSASNSSKSDKETIRLRNTPDYSINSYHPKAPPTTQYMMNNNYPSPYFNPSDKMVL